MSKFKNKTKYKCHNCYFVHDEYIDAQECCEPIEVDYFICEVCNEEFKDSKPDDHECSEAAKFMFNQQELEKNGQLRFIQ